VPRDSKEARLNFVGEINGLTLDSVIVEGRKCRRDIPVSDDITVKRGKLD